MELASEEDSQGEPPPQKQPTPVKPLAIYKSSEDSVSESNEPIPPSTKISPSSIPNPTPSVTAVEPVGSHSASKQYPFSTPGFSAFQPVSHISVIQTNPCSTKPTSPSPNSVDPQPEGAPCLMTSTDSKVAVSASVVTVPSTTVMPISTRSPTLQVSTSSSTILSAPLNSVATVSMRSILQTSVSTVSATHAMNSSPMVSAKETEMKSLGYLVPSPQEAPCRSRLDAVKKTPSKYMTPEQSTSAKRDSKSPHHTYEVMQLEDSDILPKEKIHKTSDTPQVPEKCYKIKESEENQQKLYSGMSSKQLIYQQPVENIAQHNSNPLSDYENSLNMDLTKLPQLGNTSKRKEKIEPQIATAQIIESSKQIILKDPKITSMHTMNQKPLNNPEILSVQKSQLASTSAVDQSSSEKSELQFETGISRPAVDPRVSAMPYSYQMQLQHSIAMSGIRPALPFMYRYPLEYYMPPEYAMHPPGILESNHNPMVGMPLTKMRSDLPTKAMSLDHAVPSTTTSDQPLEPEPSINSTKELSFENDTESVPIVTNVSDSSSLLRATLPKYCTSNMESKADTVLLLNSSNTQEPGISSSMISQQQSALLNTTSSEQSMQRIKSMPKELEVEQSTDITAMISTATTIHQSKLLTTFSSTSKSSQHTIEEMSSDRNLPSSMQTFLSEGQTSTEFVHQMPSTITTLHSLDQEKALDEGLTETSMHRMPIAFSMPSLFRKTPTAPIQRPATDPKFNQEMSTNPTLNSPYIPTSTAREQSSTEEGMPKKNTNMSDKLALELPIKLDEPNRDISTQQIKSVQPMSPTSSSQLDQSIFPMSEDQLTLQNTVCMPPYQSIRSMPEDQTMLSLQTSPQHNTSSKHLDSNVIPSTVLVPSSKSLTSMPQEQSKASRFNISPPTLYGELLPMAQDQLSQSIGSMINLNSEPLVTTTSQGPLMQTMPYLSAMLSEPSKAMQRLRPRNLSSDQPTGSILHVPSVQSMTKTTTTSSESSTGLTQAVPTTPTVQSGLYLIRLPSQLLSQSPHALPKMQRVSQTSMQGQVRPQSITMLTEPSQVFQKIHVVQPVSAVNTLPSNSLIAPQQQQKTDSSEPSMQRLAFVQPVSNISSESPRIQMQLVQCTQPPIFSSERIVTATQSMSISAVPQKSTTSTMSPMLLVQSMPPRMSPDPRFSSNPERTSGEINSGNPYDHTKEEQLMMNMTSASMTSLVHSDKTENETILTLSNNEPRSVINPLFNLELEEHVATESLPISSQDVESQDVVFYNTSTNNESFNSISVSNNNSIRKVSIQSDVVIKSAPMDAENVNLQSPYLNNLNTYNREANKIIQNLPLRMKPWKRNQSDANVTSQFLNAYPLTHAYITVNRNTGNTNIENNTHADSVSPKNQATFIQNNNSTLNKVLIAIQQKPHAEPQSTNFNTKYIQYSNQVKEGNIKNRVPKVVAVKRLPKNNHDEEDFENLITENQIFNNKILKKPHCTLPKHEMDIINYKIKLQQESKMSSNSNPLLNKMIKSNSTANSDLKETNIDNEGNVTESDIDLYNDIESGIEKIKINVPESLQNQVETFFSNSVQQNRRKSTDSKRAHPISMTVDSNYTGTEATIFMPSEDFNKQTQQLFIPNKYSETNLVKKTKPNIITKSRKVQPEELSSLDLYEKRKKIRRQKHQPNKEGKDVQRSESKKLQSNGSNVITPANIKAEIYKEFTSVSLSKLDECNEDDSDYYEDESVDYKNLIKIFGANENENHDDKIEFLRNVMLGTHDTCKEMLWNKRERIICRDKIALAYIGAGRLDRLADHDKPHEETDEREDAGTNKPILENITHTDLNGNNIDFKNKQMFLSQLSLRRVTRKERDGNEYTWQEILKERKRRLNSESDDNKFKKPRLMNYKRQEEIEINTHTELQMLTQIKNSVNENNNLIKKRFDQSCQDQGDSIKALAEKNFSELDRLSKMADRSVKHYSGQDIRKREINCVYDSENIQGHVPKQEPPKIRAPSYQTLNIPSIPKIISLRTTSEPCIVATTQATSMDEPQNSAAGVNEMFNGTTKNVRDISCQTEKPVWPGLEDLMKMYVEFEKNRKREIVDLTRRNTALRVEGAHITRSASRDSDRARALLAERRNLALEEAAVKKTIQRLLNAIDVIRNYR